MTESTKRKSHPLVFKAKVALKAIGGMKTMNPIAQAQAFHPLQVGQWKRAIRPQTITLFEGKRGPQRGLR